MLEPVSRSVSQDVFGFHSVFASKFLDSYSIFDWGRMPDSIPHRGKFQAIVQAFLNQRISSSDAWKIFLRSTDALAFRKAGRATAHLNELADFFPMKSSHQGIVTEENFNQDRLAQIPLTAEMIRAGTPFYILNEAYAEEKVGYVSVLGKIAWDFTAWKNKKGPKALPFEFDCEFNGSGNEDFPLISLRCFQNSFSTEISFTEALLITELSPKKLEEVILRAAWIAGFAQYQLKTAIPSGEKKIFRIRMGINEVSTDTEFAFLGTTIEFVEMEKELQKYYSSTLWGKVVTDLQAQARARGYTDWKRQCSEPAPWLDPELKSSFSNQYQKMISGIASCLSE